MKLIGPEVVQKAAKEVLDSKPLKAAMRKEMGEYLVWELMDTKPPSIACHIIIQVDGSAYCKTIYEEEGPIYTSCPKSFIKGSPTGGFSESWRKEVLNS